MHIRKSIATLSVAGLAALGMTVATGPAAHAGGYGCAGSPSWSHSVANGTVYDYFDGTNNCSVFVKSTYAGTPTSTAIQIMTNAGTWGNYNQGNFSWYAGPSSVNGVGKCIREFVYEEDPSGNVITDETTPWHSCS